MTGVNYLVKYHRIKTGYGHDEGLYSSGVRFFSYNANAGSIIYTCTQREPGFRSAAASVSLMRLYADDACLGLLEAIIDALVQELIRADPP